ncbi:YPDG domain-containing protein [Corynebacterium mastitidis]|uniref:YPDG domain-containing protein n=1 Tax=Corynebacterium mastitidis TaxID=161890 RepID=UPI0025514334|nr:YPDG domain-containing protein [Corynebacterium mastitidis]MDK8450562.1 YPDG domain-containing protein [Corynebacterium mastitidis]
MRKRVSAAAISLALAGSTFATPLALAEDEAPQAVAENTDVEILDESTGAAEEAAEAVAEEATEDEAAEAPKVTTYSADSAASTLSYGKNNEVEIPWDSEQEFEVQGTPASTARFIAPTETVQGWDYKVDEKTGKLTIKAEASRRPGSTLTLPILVRTSKGYTQIDVKATVVKGETSPSDSVTLTYPEEFTEIAPGESGTVEPTVEGTLPEGTEFVMNEKNSDGWTFKVDEKGVVTATVPKDAKVGRTWKMGLIAVFPDGSTKEYKVPVKAAAGEDSPSTNLELSYEDFEVPFGGEAKAPIVAKGGELDGTTFELIHESYAGLDFSLDSETGELTAKATDSKRGTAVWVPVKVNYADGAVDYVVFHATVGAPENAMADSADYEPAYEDVEVESGKSVEAKLGGTVPEGTRFIAPSTEGTDWTVEVAEDGTVTVTAPEAPKGSKLFIPVIVKYADGSSESVRFTAVVK